MKIIGQRKIGTPAENLRKMERLNREAARLRPYRKPRGVILKFKTWDELYEFTITRAANRT